MKKPNKEDIEIFNNSEIGKIKNKYLKKTKIVGIIAVMFSLLVIIYNAYFKESIYQYIMPITLLLFGMFFIINANIIKYKEVNKYIYKLKNSSKS